MSDTAYTERKVGGGAHRTTLDITTCSIIVDSATHELGGTEDYLCGRDARQHARRHRKAMRRHAREHQRRGYG